MLAATRATVAAAGWTQGIAIGRGAARFAQISAGLPEDDADDFHDAGFGGGGRLGYCQEAGNATPDGSADAAVCPRLSATTGGANVEAVGEPLTGVWANAVAVVDAVFPVQDDGEGATESRFGVSPVRIKL